MRLKIRNCKYWSEMKKHNPAKFSESELLSLMSRQNHLKMIGNHVRCVHTLLAPFVGPNSCFFDFFPSEFVNRLANPGGGRGVLLEPISTKLPICREKTLGILSDM